MQTLLGEMASSGGCLTWSRHTSTGAFKQLGALRSNSKGPQSNASHELSGVARFIDQGILVGGNGTAIHSLGSSGRLGMAIAASGRFALGQRAHLADEGDRGPVAGGLVASEFQGWDEHERDPLETPFEVLRALPVVP